MSGGGFWRTAFVSCRNADSDSSLSFSPSDWAVLPRLRRHQGLYCPAARPLFAVFALPSGRCVRYGSLLYLCGPQLARPFAWTIGQPPLPRHGLPKRLSLWSRCSHFTQLDPEKYPAVRVSSGHVDMYC